MGNYIISNNIVPAAQYSANSQATGFPAERVGDYTHPFRVYRATGISTSEYVAFDLGAATSIAAVVIDNTNAELVKVQSSAVADFSVLVDDVGLTMLLDPRDGRYKRYYAPVVAINQRYVRIKCNTGLTTDGSSYWEVGSVLLLTSVTELDEPFAFPFTVTSMTPHIANNDFTSGGREPVRVGHRRVRLNIEQPVMAKSSSVDTQLFTLLGSYDQGTPFVFFQNAGNNGQVYVVRRTEDVGVQHAYPQQYSIGQVTLEQV